MKLCPHILQDKTNPNFIVEDQGLVKNSIYLRFGPDGQHVYCRVRTLISGVLYRRHRAVFWDWPSNFEPHVSGMKKLIKRIKVLCKLRT